MTDEEKGLQETLDQLAPLAPDPAEFPSRASAYARLQSSLSLTTNVNNNRRITMQKYRPLAIGLAAVLLFALLFSFPTVRATASEFLGLFRVQKFAPISVSPEQLARLDELAEEGMAPGEMTVIHEPGAITPVDSLREANLETGLGGRTLQALGEAQEINVVDGGEGSLRIDLEAARALMEAAGADPLLLPDTLDGRSVHVTVFPGIEQTWDDGITLVQSPSPFVDYPADVDPQVMGEAVLQVLGTEPREARRIARSIDWAGTLLMPIPSEMVTYHEVTVDGVSGVALEPLDGSNERALMWQKDGVIYLLTGEGSADELLDLVQSLN